MSKLAFLDASGRLRRGPRGYGRLDHGEIVDFGEIEVLLVQVTPDDVGSLWVRVERVPAGVRGKLVDSDLVSPAVSYVFTPEAQTWAFAGYSRSQLLDTETRKSWVEGIAADGTPLISPGYVVVQPRTSLPGAALPTVPGVPAFTAALKVGTAVAVALAPVQDAGQSTVVQPVAFEIADDAAGTGAAAFAIPDLASMPAGAAAKYLRPVQTVTDPRQADIVRRGAWTYCAAAADTTVSLGAPPAFTSPVVERAAFTQSAGAINNAGVSTTAVLSYEMADAIVSGTAKLDLGGRRLLYTMPPIPADAVWISPTGNDGSGDGTTAAPYQTFGRGKDATAVGGTLVFRSGDYPEIYLDKSITIRSEVPLGARIVATGAAYGAIRVAAHNTAVLGFDAIGAPTGYHGIVAEDCHHVIIRGNRVRDARRNGIAFTYGEFCTIEFNELGPNNAWVTWDSGISLYQLRNISGDTTTPGFRNLVRFNYAHDNVTLAFLDYSSGSHAIAIGDIVTSGAKSGVVAYIDVASGSWGAGTAAGQIGFIDITASLFSGGDVLSVNGVASAVAAADTLTWDHTDSNGIIIDDAWNSQNGSTAGNYQFPTLVEGNLACRNGGKGIQVVWSDFVTVRGNTAWMNNRDLANTGTWRGEINVADASYCTLDGNIAVADPTRHPNNTALNFAAVSTQERIGDGAMDGTGPSGTLSDATKAITAGKLRLTNSGAAAGAFQIALGSLTPGRSYTFSGAIAAGTAPGGFQIVDPAGPTVLWSSATGTGTPSTTITPTVKALRLDLLVGSSTSGQYADFDDLTFAPTIKQIGCTVANTLTFNGTAGQTSVAVNDGGAYTAGSGNQLGVDPLLAAPPYDFRLLPGSPALAARDGTEAVALAQPLVADRTMRRKLRIKRVVTDPSLGAPLTDYSDWADVGEVPIPVLRAPATFTSALTQGMPFTLDPPVLDDDSPSTSTAITYEDATGLGGGSKAALAVVGTTMPAGARAAVRPVTTVTDELLDAPLVGYGPWTACTGAALETPTAPAFTIDAAYQLYAGATPAYSPVFTVDDVSGLNAGEAYEYRWTLSAVSPVPDTQVETGMVQVAAGKLRPIMTDPAKRVDPSTQTVAARGDFSCHLYASASPPAWDGAGTTPARDALRSTRWRLGRRKVLIANPTIASAWSEFSTQETFLASLVSTPTTWPEDCVPIIARFKEMTDARIAYGPGFQFVTDAAVTPADPDLVLCPMDIDGPWISRSFGADWTTPHMRGLYVARSGLSAWIDPADAKRQLLLYAAATQAKVKAAFGAQSGVYGTTDGGESFTLVCPMNIPQATSNDRFKPPRLIVHHPTRGTTPATREIYALHNQTAAAGDTKIAAISLWRSTAGNMGPWTKVMDLPPATYVDTADTSTSVRGIAFDPLGNLYLWSELGLWRAPAFAANAAPVFAKVVSLPAGAVRSVGFSGGKVLVAVTGASLWTGAQTAAAGTAGAYTRHAGFSAVANGGNASTPLTIAVSPVDDQYIGITVDGGNKGPMFSHGGLAGPWAYAAMHGLPGEDGWLNAASTRDHNFIVAHASNKNKWLVWRTMNWGFSDNGLADVYYTGEFYDGKHVRGFAMSPDQSRIVTAGQDYGVMASVAYGGYGPGVSWWNDQIGNPTSTYGAQICTAIANSQHISGDATLVHDNGLVISMQGNSSGKRVPVAMWPSGSDPLGNIQVYTDRVSLMTRYADWDPNDANRGFMGNEMLVVSGATGAGVTFTALGQDYCGCSKDGTKTVIYAADKGGGALRRRVWTGSAWEAAWAVWVPSGTAAGQAGDFCPFDPTPVVAVCPHHKARMYACRGDGVVVRWEGETSPTMKQVFRAQDVLPAGIPKYAIGGIAVDRNDPDILWIALYMWGVPTAWRVDGATGASPVASIASQDAPAIMSFVTALPEGSVLFQTQHGLKGIEPSAAYMAAHGIDPAANIVRRNRLFLEARA